MRQFRFLYEHHRDPVPDRVAPFAFADAYQFRRVYIVRYLAFTCWTRQNLQ